MNNNYYISQTAKLLKSFDKMAKTARKHLESYYGDQADQIIQETRLEYGKLLPEIPYIGGKDNIFTPVLMVNGWSVAYYRVMKKRSVSTEEIVKVFYEISEDTFGAIPAFILKFAGRVMNKKIVGPRFRKFAAATQQREYPENFVATFLDGEGEAFDFGWEFTECAVCKFYKEQGAEELAPYCTWFDYAQSKAMGMGMEHVTTIGNGDPVCRIEINQGEETKMNANLQKALDVEISVLEN